MSVVSKADNSSRTYIKTLISKRQCYIPFIFRSMYKDWICTTLDEMFFNKLDKEDQNRFLSAVKSEDMVNNLKNFDIENNNPIVCLFHLR